MFRRSPTATDKSDQAASDPASTDGKTQGKGRPTPKRREAEAARKNKAAPPKDRKDAKSRMREERAKERQRTQAALRSGDERHYPARDQGKARHIARNWVDGRRNVGELFWPLVIVALVFLVIPVGQLQALSTVLLLGFYFFVMGDTAWSMFGLRQVLYRELSEPSERKGAMPYAFGRSLQSRKRRMPVPQVERGWTKQLKQGSVKALD
ncbi:MAG: DUF3043 domain-containing protein [Candidatus Nanopelagicales bacterium]